MEFEQLTTNRLLLRKITPDVFKVIFEQHSEADIKKILGLSTDEEFIKQKEKYIGGYTTYDRSILLFQLVLKENNEVIGSCGYHNWYAEHRRAELGYQLLKDEYRRKGYMTEALAVILEYGFHTMDLNRVEACISPENAASLNLIKQFGFTQEGYLRQHYCRDNEIQDTIIFGLLRDEFEEKKEKEQPS